MVVPHSIPNPHPNPHLNPHSNQHQINIQIHIQINIFLCRFVVDLLINFMHQCHQSTTLAPLSWDVKPEVTNESSQVCHLASNPQHPLDSHLGYDFCLANRFGQEPRGLISWSGQYLEKNHSQVCHPCMWG